MSIRSLNIPARSAIGFGLIGLLVLFLGLSSLNQMKEMRKESSEVDRNWLPSIIVLGNLNAGMQRIRALTMRTVMLEESRDATRQTLAKLVDDLSGMIADYEKKLTTADEKAAYERFRAAQSSYMAEQRKVVEFASQDARDQAMEVMRGSINGHADAMTSALNDLQRINNDEAGRAADRALEAYETAFNWVIITISSLPLPPWRWQ